MIPVPSGVRVWLAVGRTDMRRGMNGLALQVQETLKRDPHGGDLYIFRGRRGDLIKILWHDGLGMSLYAKRLERGRFIWPSPADGIVAITPAQLAYLLEGIDWERRETDERQRVQVPYDEGVASHIGPEFMRGRPRGRTRSVDRGTRRPAIERRKTSLSERRCSPVGRRQHGPVRYREHRTAPRRR